VNLEIIFQVHAFPFVESQAKTPACVPVVCLVVVEKKKAADDLTPAAVR